MRSLLISLFILCVVAACIDRVDLPIRAEEPRLVIEGQITNDALPYAVRLTYTAPFGLTDAERPATLVAVNAQVSIGDDRGRTVRFVATAPGTYQTNDPTFQGEVGRTYSLTVVLAGGKRYVTKPEQMPAVPPIDSVSAKLSQTVNFNTPYRYQYTVSTSDPANQKNYYRWTAYGLTIRKSTGVPCCFQCPAICFDNCYTTEATTEVNVFSDAAINGNPIQNLLVFQLPVYARWPQFVEVQQYGITQTNYQFWKLYEQQRARTGSIFDPLPASVVGNLVNANDASDQARGYFAVASVSRKRIRNDAREAIGSTAVFGFLASQPVPQGDCRRTYGPVPVTLPVGWP